jgi:hypothetical protein
MESLKSQLISAVNLMRDQTTKSTIITAGVAALASLLVVAYQDYRGYVSLGPHGLPDNWYGWYRQLSMVVRARKDTTVPAPYDMNKVAEADGPNSLATFLIRPLKPRAGSRPDVCKYVVPQRQLTDQGSPAVKAEMNAYLDALVESNPIVFQRENSYLEGPVPAVQLRPEITKPNPLKSTRGEFIHVHPPDGSTHLVLSLADSVNVIEQGWGQRHRLSGVLLGWGYTLIYAPRNAQEMDVWRGIVDAAAKFCGADIAEIRLPSAMVRK